MKKLLPLLIAALLLPTVLLPLRAQTNPLAELIERDFSGRADSLDYVLTSQFLNTSKGTFYAIPRSYSNSSSESKYIYWQQAHALDVIIYAYERLKDSDDSRVGSYTTIMQRWYRNHANNWYHKSGDATGFYNEYTDDMCWICLTLLHISEALDDNTYADMARTVFDEYILPRGSRDDDGFFSLPWKDDGSGPNACTNAPGCLVAAKLYERYGDESYLQVAKDLYDYQANVMRKKLSNDGRVEEPPLTYTQGTFGEAARRLFHITGDRTYMGMATKVLNYAITSSRCTHNGLFRDEGSSMDQSIFKAVLIPYLVNYVLDEDATASYRKRMITFLQKNANTLWDNLKNDKYPKMYCNYYWGEPIDDTNVPSMGAMVSGASLMENVARMANALKATSDEDGIRSLTPNPGLTPNPIPEQSSPTRSLSPVGEGNWYDLSGRRIVDSSIINHPLGPSGRFTLEESSIKRGIYIYNGKIIIMK